MILVKDNDIFITDNNNVISAFLNNGYVAKEETPEPQPKKAIKKKTDK